MRGGVALLAWLLAAPPAGARETLATRVHRLEAEHGLVLRAPASEDAALVAEVETGLALLPPALRRPPGGPLELVLHAEPAPLGMGNGSASRPEWSEGRRRFHIYAFVPAQERRATLRTARLTDAEVERLWRRRAVVHAVVRRWDEALGWSRTARWRRLSGWLTPFERPLTFSEEALLSFAGAFSRARGQRSASLDLVTFAEELFVPVESVRAEALAVDDRERCQEPSKARALGELLAADGLGTLPPRGPCPAFDAWADVEGLSHFELLLVASSGRQPESLFGHLLMRPVWREGAVPRGPSFEAVVQPVALTGMESRGPNYLAKGLFGGYSLAFLTSTMGDLAHETLELEQRTLRRFRLRLTPSEQVRLLERVWEMERRGYLPYYFLTDNCASALLFLINGALEGERTVHAPGVLWVLPGATLDVLARVEVTDSSGERHSLVEHVPDDLESTGERALRAHEAREEALAELTSGVGPEARARLRLLHRRLRSSEPEKRREAWGRVPSVVEAALASASESERKTMRTLLHAYVAWSVRVERAEVDRAEGERLEVERARLVEVHGPLPLAEDGVRERQQLFEREDALQRRLAVLDRLTLLRDALASATRREPTKEEGRTLARAEAMEATFVTATEVQGGLHAGPLSEVDPRDFLERDRARKTREERAWASRALPLSGAARTAVGLGVDLLSSGRVRPVVTLRTAGLSEALGEAWLHGFQSSSELRVLDGELRWEPRRGVPRLLDSRLTLLGYRTLLREPPWRRRTLLDELGWGMEALFESKEDEGEPPHRATVRAEALLVLDEGPRFHRFTALGLGVQAGTRWGAEELTLAGGPRFSLSQRLELPGSRANAVRLEASWSPTFIGARGLLHEAEASLRVDLLVGQWGRRRLRLSPRAHVRWEGTFSGRPSGRAEPRLDLAVELL
jgi:hypothetical protein